MAKKKAKKVVKKVAKKGKAKKAMPMKKGMMMSAKEMGKMKY